MAPHKLTAFFELRDTADHAIREMVALGIPAGDIDLVGWPGAAGGGE